MSLPPSRRLALRGDRDGWWAAGLALAALGLYASTLCRTVYFYDSAELAAAAATLGIPHPPGYPLYTVLGHLYVRVIPGEPALAVNVMSAVHGALCVGLLFLVSRALGAGRTAAALSAALLSTGPSFWWNCNVAEVYTTGLVFVLATFWLLLAGLERKQPRLVLWAAFVAGLGFAAHMFIATLGLGYAWLVWRGSSHAAGAATSLRARLLFMGKAALATLAGASLYLYLPLRASMHPALNYAGVDRLDRFAWMITGGEYKRWFLRDYDFAERLGLVATRIGEQLTLPGTLVGLAGLVVLCMRRRELGAALALAIAGNVFFFFGYRVHDVEVFFLPAVVVLAACAGVGLFWLGERLARTPAPAVLGPLALAAAIAYVGARIGVTYPAVSLSARTDARDYGRNLAEHLPRGAVLVSAQTPEEWKYRTVFEDYFQKTLGARPDVVALSTPTRAAFVQALASGREVFMYAHVRELDDLAVFEPRGPVFRVRARGE